MDIEKKKLLLLNKEEIEKNLVNSINDFVKDEKRIGDYILALAEILEYLMIENGQLQEIPLIYTYIIRFLENKNIKNQYIYDLVYKTLEKNTKYFELRKNKKKSLIVPPLLLASNTYVSFPNTQSITENEQLNQKYENESLKKQSIENEQYKKELSFSLDKLNNINFETLTSDQLHEIQTELKKNIENISDHLQKKNINFPSLNQSSSKIINYEDNEDEEPEQKHKTMYIETRSDFTNILIAVSEKIQNLIELSMKYPFVDPIKEKLAIEGCNQFINRLQFFDRKHKISFLDWLQLINQNSLSGLEFPNKKIKFRSNFCNKCIVTVTNNKKFTNEDLGELIIVSNKSKIRKYDKPIEMVVTDNIENIKIYDPFTDDYIIPLKIFKCPVCKGYDRKEISISHKQITKTLKYKSTMILDLFNSFSLDYALLTFYYSCLQPNYVTDSLEIGSKISK